MNGGRGAHLWVHAGPLCDADGIVEGAIETIRDISEIHQIKHDLDLSRDANLGFANILPVGVYEMDPVCRLTFANTRAYEMFGLVPEDFRQDINILDYITTPDRERAFRDIQRAARQGTSNGQEYLLQKSDGSTFPALIYGAPVIDPETKQPVGLRGIIIDQTRRRQDAQALHESEERLKLALMAGEIGIWDVDMRTLVVRDISEWANTIMGYNLDPQSITIGTCKSLIHLLDMPRVLLAFFQHLKGKRPYFESEFRLRHHDGTWRWVSVRGNVIERAASGELVRITGTISMMTKAPDDPASHRNEPAEPGS